MKAVPSYPKVYGLGHAMIGELMDDCVQVEEKVDGSQFSFGVYDGELRCRSKGKDIVLDAPEKMFQPAIDSIRELAPLLKQNYTYRAEFLGKPKHNVLAYDRVPIKNLILFDVDDGLQNYWTYVQKQTEAERIGLECVPLLYEGRLDSYDMFEELLKNVSVLGGQNIEGVVIKNYIKFSRDGKAMMGKYVAESFKEKHKKDWKVTNPTNSDFVAALGDSFRTDARWEKAIQHLKEREELQNAPQDIGNLMREISKDVAVECRDEILNALWKHAWPKISRIVLRGFPQWYKERLAKSQFAAQPEPPAPARSGEFEPEECGDRKVVG